MHLAPRPLFILLSLIIVAAGAGSWMVSIRNKNISQESEAKLSKNENLTSATSLPTAEVALPKALIEFTENFLGLQFQTPPPLLLGDQELIIDAASQKWSELNNSYFMKMHYALEAVGVLPPKLNLGYELITAETLGVRGAYDHIGQQIVLNDDIDFESIPDQAEIIKLLVIALVHQSSQSVKPKNLQEFIAHRSLEMGTSSLATERFYAVSARHFDIATRHRLNSEEQKAFDQLSSFVKHLTVYPRRVGETFLKERTDTRNIFSKGIPKITNTYHLLSSNRQEYKFELGEGHIEFRDHLGPCLAVIPVLEHLDAEASANLARSLADDQITLFTKPESAEVIARWQTHWKTKEAAKQFYKILEPIHAKLEHSKINLEGSNVTIVSTRRSPLLKPNNQ